MKREVKYIYNKAVVLEEEKEWLNNHKLYRVLKALVQETKDFGDKNIAYKCGVSVNTYQKYKSELIFIGLLQVRKLNATTYFIAIGEEAIEIDDKYHKNRDNIKIVEATLLHLGYNISSLLIEDPKNLLEVPKQVGYLDSDKKRKYLSMIRLNPMPESEDIL